MAMSADHFGRLADAILGSEQHSQKRGESPINRPTVQHGVNDSFYPNTISGTQVSKAVNFDLTKDGQLETRGGTQLLSDTAVASTGTYPHEHLFVKRASDGTLTRIRMLKSGTVLYKYNTSTGVFDSVQTALSTARPCMVNFVNTAGDDVMLYCDQANFLMYDGTTVTDILSNFTAGNATSAPAYLFVKHSVVFASGVKEDPDVIFWCGPRKPDSNWPSQGFAILEGGAAKITGIGELYSYIVVTSLNGVHLMTGRTSASFSFFAVNSQRGCTSHWSIVSQGGYIYFANADGFYVGKLRAAEDDGMDVEAIGSSMQNTFIGIADGYWDNIVGAYHAGKREIFWTVRSAGQTNPDRLFVYSEVLSHPEASSPAYGLDTRYVWAGYYEGLNFNSISVMQDANGKAFLSIVDASGKVYTAHTGYKDARAVGADTGTDIAYEIRPREETFGRTGSTVRVTSFFPTLYQKHNGGFSVQFLLNRTTLFPASPIPIAFSGNIPYWNDGTDPRITAAWGNTVWTEKPILSAKIGVKQKCYSIIPIITSDGSNTKEEGSFIGYGMLFQRLPQAQGRAV